MKKINDHDIIEKINAGMNIIHAKNIIKMKSPIADLKKKYHLRIGNGLISLTTFSPSCNSNSFFMFIFLINSLKS